jgi:hypothetical protein
MHIRNAYSITRHKSGMTLDGVAALFRVFLGIRGPSSTSVALVSIVSFSFCKQLVWHKMNKKNLLCDFNSLLFHHEIDLSLVSNFPPIKVSKAHPLNPLPFLPVITNSVGKTQPIDQTNRQTNNSDCHSTLPSSTEYT